MSFSEDLISQIDDYLDNNLDAGSRQRFEKQMNLHSELKELVSLNQQMREQYNDDDWSCIEDSNIKRIEELETYFKSEEGLSDAVLLKTVNEKYRSENKPVKTLNRNIFIGIAASLLIVFGYFMFNKKQSNTDLYSEYSDWSNLPSLVIKGNSQNNVLADAENAFISKDYKTAIANFEHYLEQEESVNANVLIYYGLSQLELNKYSESLKVFNQLIRSNSIDKSKGYWYKALIYLKMNDKEKVKKELMIILKDPKNFNYQKAKVLFDELK